MMPRRVLLAWEFGAGLAHVMLLAGVGRHLRVLSEDLELIYALRDPDAGRNIGLPVEEVVAAPLMFPKPGFQTLKTIPSHSTFGGMIGEVVVGERQDSFRYFDEWSQLITSVKPDVIVADYAPVVTMLARGRVPTVACGIGYSLPPVNIPVFPPVTKSVRPPLVSEEELLQRFNVLLEKMGAKTLDRLTQVNEADAYGLCTVPDLDPYANVPGREWLGAMLPGGAPDMVDGHAGGLAYFHQKQQFEDSLIDGLIQSGVDIKAFMGEPLRRTRKRAQATGLHFSDEHFELQQAMPGRAIAIHSGSLGFSAAAAFAGVPQVMLPRHQEHYGNAHGVVARGAGVLLPPSKRTAAVLARTIREVAESETMRAAAQAFAVSLDPWRKADPARVIAERTLALLNINA